MTTWALSAESNPSEIPPLPPAWRVVLVRVATSAPRPLARQEVRAVLRRIIAAWSGATGEPIALIETPRGPVWDGELAGHSLDLSLSYTNREAWIGLRRGGAIGVDAMTIAAIPEAEAVARLYLGPATWAAIQSAPDPVRAFAQAWTALEARFKCVKQSLTEWPANQNQPPAGTLHTSHYFERDLVVAVVTDEAVV
jgi:4'-phosphopantetheinyl transferase